MPDKNLPSRLPRAKRIDDAHVARAQRAREPVLTCGVAGANRLLHQETGMAEAEQSFTADVEASIDDCCAVLLDFERYPQWSGPTTAARILERGADGRARQVEMTLDMKIRNVRYVLEYRYDLPSQAHWRLIEGDVAGVDGSYTFERIDDTHTRATCQQSVDLGFWVPGPLRRLIEKQALRDSVLEFKAEAERRARASA
jgi:hypothetical protein